VGSSLKADRDRGDLEIVLSASPQNVEPAISIVRDQLERLRTQPVTQTELADAKIRLISSALLNEASASGQLDEISEIAQNRLALDYYTTLAQRYAAITPADIQRTAKAFLRPDKLIEVFSGPDGPWATRSL
jgi:zinc protease